MKNRLIIFVLTLFLSGVVQAGTFVKSLWIHSSLFSIHKKEAESQLKKKFLLYSKAGITDLYFYNTLSEQHNRGWDFLGLVLKLAHRNKLRIHPVITPGYRLKPSAEAWKNPQWLIKNVLGVTQPFLNLSNPGARQHLLIKIKKLLNYNIDGIHLDYIRFPYPAKTKTTNPAQILFNNFLEYFRKSFFPVKINPILDNYFSYDKETLELFEDEYDFEPVTAAGQNNNINKILSAWVNWNTSNVTDLVRSTKKIISGSGKKIPLSAAVFVNQNFAKTSLAQDWYCWAKKKYIDVLCPMIYTNSLAEFKNRLSGFLKIVAKKCKVYAGIAILSTHNKNTVGGFLNQQKIARQLNADGVAIFSGYSFKNDFLKIDLN